ncbi:T9SS type A sorting domain-containing protein [Hymenobacter sp. UV11]|uniref:T9SS type A sorting domain-containing protein n=1 Tax=Hymenobacter sp. UV11 TaxID=1849735 RepID=UPI00105CB7C6|nr:T9SS type A sorting domain-containing protein [Hymenobacter sp. UV11]TDN39394.1 hypothetical protein A8B98_19330 [Hymenobacter sp. UV11]TFZ65517.1 T9SS type A sorting domain-containing protein [Hymenobacter sp. UV11]
MINYPQNLNELACISSRCARLVNHCVVFLAGSRTQPGDVDGHPRALLGGSNRAVVGLCLFLLVLSSLPAWAQQGKNGPGVITAAGTIVNVYTSLTADAAAGAATITVSSSTLTGSAFTGSLAAGDLLMLIQMQGATINTAVGSSAYGAVTAYNNAGRYELAEVRTVPNGTTVTLQCGLNNSYTATGNVQVVRVPRYTTLTLNANTSIVASAWNGARGGIVALEVQGTTTLSTGAAINVSGLGFRGGAIHNQSTFPNGGTGYASTSALLGAEKGESIAGSSTTYDGLTGRYGRGAPANGGGGGNTHNAGGGGGANGGTGSWTGTGNPNRGPGNAYDNAWNLEAASFATSTSSGGGRGGYTYSVTNQDAGTVGPGSAAWGGDNRLNQGGFGGRPLDATNRLFFGGGGGAGDENNGVGSAGANGGGLIYLLSGGNLDGSSASLQANGAAAANAGSNDAAGGGGGGGAIGLNISGTIAAGATVSATGGTGGTTNSATDNEAEGGGGGGGGGYISSAVAVPTLTVAAGANGISISASLTEFPPNGTTAGAAGTTTIAAQPDQCAIVADATTTLSGPTAATVVGGVAGPFTVTFTNGGPDIAAAVTRTVTLPAGGTLTATQVSALPAGATYTSSTRVIDFGTLTTLAAGATASLQFSFTAPATAATATLTSNIATATAQGLNPNPDAATLSLPFQNTTDCGPSYFNSAAVYSGLSADYYSGYFNNNKNYFTMNAAKLKRLEANVNYTTNTDFGDLTTSGAANSTAPVNQTFSALYRGSLSIATAGLYTFYLTVDNLANLFLDGAALAYTSSPALASATSGSVSVAVNLSAGPHNLAILYGANGATSLLKLEYANAAAGIARQVIPSTVLCAGLSNLPPIAVAPTPAPVVPANAGPTSLPALAGTDQDGSVVQYAVSLPTAAQGVLYVNGQVLNASNFPGLLLTAAQATQLSFAPTSAFVGPVSFTFYAIDDAAPAGQYSNDFATYSLTVGTVVAYARTAQIMLNTYGNTLLAVPLAAAGATGTISSYKVTVLPPAGAGVLRLGGTAVTTTTVIAAASVGSLTFDPAPGYFGTAVFQYTAQDNNNAVSAAVTYGIPVAKATCGAGEGQANNLTFFSRTVGEDWRATQTATVGGVTVTANPVGSPYAAAAGTTNSLTIEDLATKPGKGLAWTEDYSSSAAATASVTFTFSQPVANFSLTASSIDAGTGVIDQLLIQGYDASNNLVAIPSTNAATGATSSYSNNTFTGTATDAGLASNNVLATFPAAISRLVLTYRNVTTQANPAVQTLVFPAFAWCAQSDVQITLAGPARAQASSTVTYTVTTLNVGNDQVNTITPTVQLPTGLNNVTGGGVSYNSVTGVLTMPVISNLAVGASVVQLITYRMPTTGAVTATASFASTADDPVASNNTSTITTAQNRAPVASDVTNAPAILSSTTSQTALASFNASDPDASAGNTTLISYTIVSLPTAAQGTLYVNGIAATLGQVITVPTSATAAVPGYQLSFVPNGTFAGSASFTYKATDDTNTASNTATYFVPVTAGADLVSIVGGTPTGVQGQTKGYSVTTTNNGPATATGVVPTLTLSSKPPFSSVTVTNGSYDPGTGVVTFTTLPSLTSGTSVVNNITLVAQLAPPSFTLTAANTAATADPAPANNNGSAPAAVLTVTIAGIGPAGVPSACATPGRDGSPTLTASPNTYFPATNQTLAVGATALVVGPGVGPVPIVAGDLLLVIQMQGADIDFSNTDAYGDGVAGGLATSNLSNANFTAGLYEYVVAAAAVPLGGGPVTITTGLKNSYQNADATAGAGQRRFQVVRIPQYDNLTVSGTVAPSAWDGSTGGILALDVTGQLTFAAGARLDASGKGFRGGAGQQLNGITGVTGTDYRNLAPATGTTTVGAHGMKGEGTAGTPRYVNTGTALLDTGVEGYPSGSAARGAPGNAGGGGTDATSTNNQNSGGGGGGNGARGGRGGNTFSSNLAVGGEPGAGFLAPSTSRLILGGGGGAGSTNGGSGTVGHTGYASSGAAGGGILLVRTGSVAGSGTLLANGAAASNAVVADGSGGGGAGGSILLTANNTGSLNTLSLTASGGNGGSNSAAAAEGPGGGGGGGIILSNAATASAVVANGAFGTSAGSAYGAAAGLPGIANNQINNSIAGSSAGISCNIDVTAVLTAPAQATAAQTVNVAAVFANNGGAAASGVTRTVTLSSGSNTAGNIVTNVVAPGSTSITPDALTGDVTIVYPGVSPLSAGGSSQFNLSYTAPGTTSVVATAHITTTSGESVTTNNTSVATTAITGYADVVGVIFGLGTSTTGRPSGTYGALFANNGPAAALNVTRTVTLPAGSTLTPTQLTALTAQGATYNSGTLLIDFGNLATLNNRDVSVFRFTYTASDMGGSTAIVSRITTTSQQDALGGTGAPTAPDTFSFPILNNSAADVATDGITASVSTAVPGQQVSFDLAFRNNGPGDAINALRSAQLTPGLSVVSISGGGVYDILTGIVAYPPLSTLANGGTAPSTITFLAPAIGPVSISGSMTTGAGSISSGIFGNNEANATIAVTPVADVATGISGPATSAVGNLVTYALITANNGPSAAANVVQTAQLPTGLAPAGVFASSQGSYNTATGVVTFPAVAVLASAAMRHNTVSFSMPASGFTATAGVSTTTSESGATANNTAATGATSAVAVAPTDPRANVYNTLGISDKNVAPGALVTLTVVTGNKGPGLAQNVGQQLSLRPGLSIASGDISGGGTYNASTGIVTFPALASLASGSTATNTVTLTAPAAGPLVATASTTAATADPVPADNLATRNVDISSQADVATLLIGPEVASATQVTTFTVNTSNNGPVPATNVVQTVSIPAGFAPAAVTTTGGGSYAPATGFITWPAVATLAVGEQRTYSYSYVAPAFPSTDANNPRVVVSQATVTSSTPDATTTNNSSVVKTLIKWNADVAIAITGPASGMVGSPLVFTVSTTNNGPAPAATVNTSVRVTTGLNVVASGGGVYNINTGIVTFPAITNQAVGVTGVVTNTITIISPERPIIGASAAADIPTGTNDINLTNNAVTFVLPLSPITPVQTDFQVTLVANRTAQQAGQPVVLTLTATNANATGTAADMQAQLSLPGGMSGVVVSGGGTYDAASGAVTFPVAASQPANSTLTYTVTVNNPGNDPLVATAAINGNFSDAQPANNTQVVSVSINPVADVATRVAGPATALPGGLTLYAVTTLNNGPSPASAVVQTVQLPTGLGAVAVSGGGTYDAVSGLVTFPTIATQAVGQAGTVTNTLAFLFPTTASAVVGTVGSGTAEGAGTTSDNTATLTTTLTNQVPLANTVNNLLQTPEGNTAGPLVLTALKGFDADGSLASFTITTLPAPTAGVLALQGAAVMAGQVVSNGNAANLTFDPAGTFVGNAFFTFTATDNQGAVAAPAFYTIAVGQDIDAVYTSTPVKGGLTQYQDGDIIANVFDANSGSYDAALAITDNGVRTATAAGPLPDGLELDPTTGQVRVLDRSLLVAGTYPVSLTTVDANGGVTTQAVSLLIGDNPLPVGLTRFEVKAAGTDAQLSWATAQELDNAGFQVERSLDGSHFVRLRFVPGAGTTTLAHQYTYVDAGVGQQHSGAVYYRLQQLDFNGNATYSPVRTLVFAPEVPSLYPNPAHTYTTLNLTSLPPATYAVTMLDMTGRVVQAYALDGGKAHELALDYLASGAYLVIIRGDGLKIIKHLLKQ